MAGLPSPGRYATFSKGGGGICPGLAAGPYRRSGAARPCRTSRKKPAIENHEESVHMEARRPCGGLRPLTWVSYPRRLVADGELGIIDRSSLAVVSWVKRLRIRLRLTRARTLGAAGGRWLNTTPS